MKAFVLGVGGAIPARLPRPELTTRPRFAQSAGRARRFT